MSFTSRRIKQYWGRFLLFVFLVAMSVAFTIATALSVADFLRLLFGDTNITSEPSLTTNNMVSQGLSAIYDWLIVYGTRKALILFSLLVLATYTLKNIFSYLAAITMAFLRCRLVEGIRNDLFVKATRLSSSYYTTHRKGDILSRFSGDIVEYEENIVNSLQTLCVSVVSILFYLAMLFYINVKLSLFVLCMLPIVAFVISGITRKLKRNSVELQERNSWLMSMMEETMMGLKIIKAYTAIDFSNRRFRKADRAYANLRVKVYRRIDSASPVSDFLGNVIVIGILLFGSSLVLSGDNGMTPELFISYIMMFVLMISPAKDLTTALSQIKKGRGCEERFQQLLDSEEESAGGDLVFSGLQSGITFNGLCFRYPSSDSGHEWVLDHIDLHIPKGGQVALVGSSGSGKSTLVDIVGRFYDATSGQLLFDGIPAEQYNVASVRRHIGVVAQDTLLFNDTVASNIAFGMEQASREQIEEAARIANAHDFIMQLQQGYDTNIGDRGETLSGGQRQRLSIARAVLRRPDILIFDEATSALDTESERLVQQALDQVMQNRTTIIIAHRLSTIAHIKDIVVLEHGRIVERGSHDELMRMGGRYRELVELQRIEGK